MEPTLGQVLATAEHIGDFSINEDLHDYMVYCAECIEDKMEPVSFEEYFCAEDYRTYEDEMKNTMQFGLR